MDAAGTDRLYAPAAPDLLAVLAGTALTLWLALSGEAGLPVLLGPLALLAFGGWSLGRTARLRRAAERGERDAQQAQEAVEASIRRARDFADASSNWFWETDSTHHYSFVTDRLREILGGDPPALLGESLFDLERFVDDRETWRDCRAEIEAGEPFRDLEVAVEAADGRILILRLSGKPVHDAAGRFIGYRGCGVDMTAETMALIEARFMHTIMHDALESISEGFVLFDAEGRLLVCNDRYRQAYPNLADLLVPGAGFADILRAAAERGGYEGDLGRWVEDRLKRHLRHSAPVDGRLSDGRWYRISEHETGTGGVVKILMDITELKHREEELAGQTRRLEQTVSALSESERRYRQLVELAPYGILIWDRTAVRFANSAAATLLGFGTGAAQGNGPMALEGLALTTFLDGDPEIEQTVAALADGAGRRVEAAVLRPSGERRQVEIGASPVVYHGEPAILLVLNDVTDRRRVEAELQRAQKMEAVGRMAGGIAHEFNNMLTAIGGFARLVERNPGDPARVLGCVAEIAKASDRAAALTAQLLDFSHRRVGEEKQLVPLAPLVRDLRVFLKPLVSAGIDLTIDIRDEDAHAVVNPVTLNQAVLNLALNARDAMPGGGRLNISLEVIVPDEAFFARHSGLADGRYAVIRVTDEGCGVPDAIRDRIWEPFFTTKEPGKGTGLGLWMVYGTAGQAGGAVEMDSRPGEGSSFAILLPAVEPPAQGRALEPLTVVGGESAAILLADDESSVRTYLRLVLEEAGCTVTEAADGAEALELYDAKGGLFDAVVSDLSMPRMNGTDLGRALEERNPEIRILYLTGYASREAAAGLTAPPGRKLVMKPVAPERLLQALRDLLAD